jgi:endonuclease/exonuclease/phosphatase family metal-dependent hydrolase
VRVRVLTYNIHKCIGGVDRRYQPERIAQAIGHYQPQLVLLQEVDQGAKRSSYHRQVDWLGDRLGLRYRTFFPNVHVRSGGAYGNAILSDFQLTETRNVDLTVPGKKRRSVLHGWYRVQLPGHHTRTMHVFNLHLGLSGRERKVQLQTFLESHPFAHLHHRTPIVVAGDFNDVWGTLGRQLAPVGFRGMPKALRTFPAYAPVRALDSIYVRGDARIRKVFRGEINVAKRASDHLPLVADVEITARS